MKKQLLAALLFGGVTGMLFGLEPLLFDRTQWKPVNLKHPGSETVELGTAPLGDTGRILVRESGTEPVVRVMVEAPDHDTCQKYVSQVVETIKSRGYGV